jgi:trehalose-6-phosphate synthase
MGYNHGDIIMSTFIGGAIWVASSRIVNPYDVNVVISFISKMKWQEPFIV